MVKENKKVISEINKNKSKKSDTYGKIALVIIIFYIIGLGYFLYNAHVEIKTIRSNILEKQKEEAFLKSKMERLKLEKINRIYLSDFKKDSSITKFVNSSVSFNDKAYVPENLIGFGTTYIVDTKGYGVLRNEAMNALIRMNEVFYKNFNKNIIVISSYRSYAYQKGIKDRGCPDNLCAKAGYSEHQSGLAVDLWEATTNSQFLSKEYLRTYFEWLNENAHTFGFHNTYQKGLEIDGYEIEPWHWRYMGTELATYLKENNITIAEFYNNKKG